MKNLYNKKIPYSTHYVDKNDIRMVTEILKSRFLTQGNSVLKFEKNLAKYVGAKYAVAVSSCTAGMHIACKALGFDKNSTLLTSVISFVSSANVGHFLNGKVDFLDIDPKTINMDVDKLKKKLKYLKPKIVIPVHMGGYPCDVKKIRNLSKKYNFKIIEDAAHALGSTYNTKGKKIMVGSCKYSDATVFSFHPVKTITTGEGGVITTNSKDIYLKLLRLRSHGINKLNDKPLNKKNAYTKNKLNPWYYEMRELGYHYRITDIQCALGLGQLKKINLFLEKRKKIALKYDQAFKDIKNIECYQGFNRNRNSNHLYIIKIDFKKINKSRSDLMNYLQTKNIITQVHYIPIVMHPFYQKLGFKINNYPEAKRYYEKCLSIPNYYRLTKKKQLYVIEIIKKFLVKKK